MEGQSLITLSCLLLTRLLFSFRWVYCQLDMLRHCFPPSVRRVLDELPEALDGTYERILMEIKLPNRNQAHRIFQCLAVAIRPLRVVELAEVLAVDFDTEGATPKLNVHRRCGDPEQAVLSACSSLVTIVDIAGTRVVNFTHFSVMEFLTSSRLATSSGRVSSYHISLEPAHIILAQACLSVLLLLDDHFDLNIIGHFPLAEYAAKHWVDHARFDNVTSHIQEEMELLFDSEKPHFANWVSVYDVDEAPGLPTLPHPMRPNAAPLYYAALCGFDSLVERLIDTRPMDVDARGGHHERAIQAALYKGHLAIVSLLIDRGADINSQDVEGSSLLHVAAQTGDPKAVSLLIECGADVGVRDGDCSTALHIASGNEHLGVVQLLLARGAEVDPQDNHGSTPLHLASTKGNDTIARLLMEHGADPSALDNTSSMPLHLASMHGNSNVVVLLVRHGAYVDACDNENSTPLHLASAKGNPTVVRLLLDHGANMVAPGEKDNTPLHVASWRGSFAVVKLLLERGAQPNAQNDEGRTPLHTASQEGAVDVVQCLLTGGANMNIRDHNGKTPRDVASNNSDVIQLLTGRARPNKRRDSRNRILSQLQTAATREGQSIIGT